METFDQHVKSKSSHKKMTRSFNPKSQGQNNKKMQSFKPKFHHSMENKKHKELQPLYNPRIVAIEPKINLSHPLTKTPMSKPKINLNTLIRTVRLNPKISMTIFKPQIHIFELLI
jgi:hypothetical protein